MKRIILFSLAILTAGCQSLKPAPQTYTWTVLAGQPGTPGYADGIGSTARFNSPWGVAVDGEGNVFVADTENQKIRIISRLGAVTTLPVNSADLYLYSQASMGLAVDAAGNVFVTDINDGAVFEVTGGKLTFLADRTGNPDDAHGPVETGRFAAPSGVAVDKAGNVYVADSGNHTVRKMSMVGTNWVVTTLAGSSRNHGSNNGIGSAARFNCPRDVAVDSAGNVYVADNGNHTIRRVSKSGVVTTLAGRASHPGRTDGIGGSARFSHPNGVAVDNLGNVYVTDADNQLVRKVSAAGVVTTIGGPANFVDPFGIAVDRTGNLYVADVMNDCIFKGTPSRR